MLFVRVFRKIRHGSEVSIALYRSFIFASITHRYIGRIGTIAIDSRYSVLYVVEHCTSHKELIPRRLRSIPLPKKKKKKVAKNKKYKFELLIISKATRLFVVRNNAQFRVMLSSQIEYSLLFFFYFVVLQVGILIFA